MVKTGKIFEVERVEMENVLKKLKDFKIEKEIEGIKIKNEVKDLTLKEDLKGIFCQDKIIEIYQHGEVKKVVKTFEIPFIFSPYNKKIFLIIMERKRIANNIANQLSKIIFMEIGKITECNIAPNKFREFHEKNKEDTKVIFFDQVDIPNIEKLSLYGNQLENTNLYNEYLKHGEIWYIVLKVGKMVIGITRNCVVTLFSKEEKNFIEYIKKNIFPLIE